MNKEELTEFVEQAKSESGDRNFKQTVEFIINLKDVNINNPDEQVEFFVTVPNDLGMERSICAFVGPELEDQAEDVCDEVIHKDDFDDYEAREAKKLAQRHDYFIAQANVMPNVANAFGKYLGPRGKMPNPNAGSVVAPNADVKPQYEKLQNTIKVQAKNTPIVQVMVGKEDLDDEVLADNAAFIYDKLVHQLPKEDNNVGDVYVKTTMGKPVQVN